ncbi:hypothetical protein V8G54_013309 [Vigna mungo]|uniref:Uncharacterized protein n=1 Tax=Vigna mungo TaxID=3915 RepID=A0AAQ3NWM5_VIGMU
MSMWGSAVVPKPSIFTKFLLNLGNHTHTVSCHLNHISRIKLAIFKFTASTEAHALRVHNIFWCGTNICGGLDEKLKENFKAKSKRSDRYPTAWCNPSRSSK